LVNFLCIYKGEEQSLCPFAHSSLQPVQMTISQLTYPSTCSSLCPSV
jgi:hypothetical protein